MNIRVGATGGADGRRLRHVLLRLRLLLLRMRLLLCKLLLLLLLKLKLLRMGWKRRRCCSSRMGIAVSRGIRVGWRVLVTLYRAGNLLRRPGRRKGIATSRPAHRRRRSVTIRGRGGHRGTLRRSHIGVRAGSTCLQRWRRRAAGIGARSLIRRLRRIRRVRGLRMDSILLRRGRLAWRRVQGMAVCRLPKRIRGGCLGRCRRSLLLGMMLWVLRMLLRLLLRVLLRGLLRVLLRVLLRMLLRELRMLRMLLRRILLLLWRKLLRGRRGSSSRSRSRAVGVISRIHQGPEIHSERRRRANGASIPWCCGVLSSPTLRPASAGMRKVSASPFQYQQLICAACEICDGLSVVSDGRDAGLKSRRDFIGTSWIGSS